VIHGLKNSRQGEARLEEPKEDITTAQMDIGVHVVGKWKL